MKENEELNQRLCKVTLKRNDFIFNLSQIEREIIEIQGNASKVIGKRKRIKYFLDTIILELDERNEELQNVVKENKEFGAWWDTNLEERMLMREIL